jgi:small subunit ribosomal protein S15
MYRNRKDHSGRRGLIAMVSRRRKLLDYVRKQNNESYLSIIKKLNIRK